MSIDSVPVPGSCSGDPPEVHLHFYGFSAEDVAAIVSRVNN
jgi:hypothetical protein